MKPGPSTIAVIARDPVIAVIRKPCSAVIVMQDVVTILNDLANNQKRSDRSANSKIKGKTLPPRPLPGLMMAASALLIFLSLPVTIPAQEPQHPQSSASAASTQQSATAEKPAEASKEAEGDSNEQFRHSPSVKAIARMTGLSLDAAYWLCVVLNFMVVFAVLWMLLRKALPALYRNRTEMIQRRLEEARKASEDARRRLSDVEARLSRLDTEIERMRLEAEASGKTEEERMMAAAEEERRRIVESAEQEIASAAAAARRELKAFTADLAVSLAEKKIRITESADEQLVRNFASRLGKDSD